MYLFRLLGVILCGIYTFAGASAFVAFLILGNYPGSVWAFATGLISAITTHLRWLKYKNSLIDWYTHQELHPLMVLGFICFTIGAMGVVYHTAIQILLNIAILPINSSEVIPLVWAFITAKSGIILMYTARNYIMLEDEERSAFATDNDNGSHSRGSGSSYNSI